MADSDQLLHEIRQISEKLTVIDTQLKERSKIYDEKIKENSGNIGLNAREIQTIKMEGNSNKGQIKALTDKIDKMSSDFIEMRLTINKLEKSHAKLAVYSSIGAAVLTAAAVKFFVG
jgi:chromosome segregation ATPase